MSINLGGQPPYLLDERLISKATVTLTITEISHYVVARPPAPPAYRTGEL